MQGNPNVYPVFDRDSYLELHDDPQTRFDCAVAFDVPEDELTDRDLYYYVSDLEGSDLAEEVAAIERAFAEGAAAEHPEWGGSYTLMAKGSVERWNGVSRGHGYYDGARRASGRDIGPFAQLLSDNGYYGVFRDCEIDSIVCDREGTVHVRGVHHDGAVEVAVRAAAADTQEIEDDWEWYFEEGGKPLGVRDQAVGDDVARAVAAHPDDSKGALDAFLEARWAEAACARIDAINGYTWPSIDDSPALDDEASLRQYLGIDKDPGYAQMSGYRVGADFAVGAGLHQEPLRLDLVTSDREAFYVSDDSDETAGVVLVVVDVTPDGGRKPRLASDNFLAANAYVEACSDVAEGRARPLFCGYGASCAIQEERRALKAPEKLGAAARGAAAKSAAVTEGGIGVRHGAAR